MSTQAAPLDAFMQNYDTMQSSEFVPTTRREVLRCLGNIRHNYASMWSCVVERRDGHRWELYKLCSLPAFEIYRSADGDSFTAHPKFLQTFNTPSEFGRVVEPATELHCHITDFGQIVEKQWSGGVMAP